MHFGLNSQARHQLGSRLIEVVNNYFGSLPDRPEEVNRDGQRWISGATVNGKSVIRTMIISYLTGTRHLEGLQEALQAAALKIVPVATVRA